MAIDAALLAGMYKLPHRELEFLQEESYCEEYLKIFALSLRSVWESDTVPEWCRNKAEVEMIKSCKVALSSDDGGDSFLLWTSFRPEYGSLILAHKSDEQCVDTIMIEVLGLDAHVFDLHNRQPSPYVKAGDYDYTGTAMDYRPLFAGQLDESELEDTQTKFRKLL